VFTLESTMVARVVEGTAPHEEHSCRFACCLPPSNLPHPHPHVPPPALLLLLLLLLDCITPSSVCV